MKTIKKLLVASLVVIMMLSLTGCGTPVATIVRLFADYEKLENKSEPAPVVQETKVIEDYNNTSGQTELENFVETTGDSFLNGFEYGFEKGSGGTACSSEMKAEGNDLYIWLRMEGIDELDRTRKAEFQEYLDSQNSSFKPSFQMIDTFVPSMETVTLYWCEEDGDIIGKNVLYY